jgi:hypothetical protein
MSYVDDEVSGRVVTALGVPLAGAAIMLVNAAGQEVDRTHSAQDGTFGLALPDGDRYLLLITATGRQPVMDLVEAGRSGPPRDIMLERFSSGVSGVVTDRRYGQPVLGAQVALIDHRGVVVSRTVTAADGRYAFPALPAGSYSIEVSSHGPAVSAARLSPGERAELDLTLPQTA